VLVDGEGVERYSHVQQVAPSRRSGGGHVVDVCEGDAMGRLDQD
jgi:hypothetical protein